MALKQSNIKNQRKCYYLKYYDRIFGKFSNLLNHQDSNLYKNKTDELDKRHNYSRKFRHFHYKFRFEKAYPSW